MYKRQQLRKMLLDTQAESAYGELSSLDDQFAAARRCTLLYYDTHYLPCLLYTSASPSMRSSCVIKGTKIAVELVVMPRLISMPL